MKTNFEKYKNDLDKLLKEGEILDATMIFEQLTQKEKNKLRKKAKDKGIDLEQRVTKFSEKYQSWYSEALECIRQILPIRMEDFINFYKPTAKRKEITCENYTIHDYLQGLQVTMSRGWEKEKVVGPEAAEPKFRQQLKILESLKRKFESSLFDIDTLVQADLFDSELNSAKELNKKGFMRGAGAIAGVVLEKHLLQVCENHQLKVAKKDPTINDLNDLIKGADVIDVTTWRFIQHLLDLRNLCDHNKQREPEKGEIEELIKGVEKATKTIY